MELTKRMADWISKLGLHIAFADQNSFPTVIVTASATVEGKYIHIQLQPNQIKQIQHILAVNTLAAAAPAGIGAVRAPYQFKGPTILTENTLTIKVEEIYCTKPGSEAGIRLDTLGSKGMKHFDESRWTDLVPVK